MGTTRSRWRNSILEYYDSSTFETLRAMAPLWFKEDFVGYQLNDYVLAEQTGGLWLAKDTANATEDLLADGASGVLALLLTNANEKQEAGLYWGDQRPLILNQGLNIEFRAAVHTAPTLQSELYFGLAGDYVEGPIAEGDAGPAEHAFFCCDGGLAVTIHTDDTATDKNAISTGITLVADEYHVFRIDCTTITDVKFYIDGNRVAASTAFDMSAVPGLKLQPFLMAHKEAAAGVGGLYVDYVAAWQKRA